MEIKVEYIGLNLGNMFFKVDSGTLFLFKDGEINHAALISQTIKDSDYLISKKIITSELFLKFLDRKKSQSINLGDVSFSGDRESLFKLNSFLLGISINKALNSKEISSKLKDWLNKREKRNLPSDLLKETIYVLDRISVLLPFRLYEDPLLSQIESLTRKLSSWEKNRKGKNMRTKEIKAALRIFKDISSNKDKVINYI